MCPHLACVLNGGILHICDEAAIDSTNVRYWRKADIGLAGRNGGS